MMITYGKLLYIACCHIQDHQHPNLYFGIPQTILSSHNLSNTAFLGKVKYLKQPTNIVITFGKLLKHASIFKIIKALSYILESFNPDDVSSIASLGQVKSQSNLPT